MCIRDRSLGVRIDLTPESAGRSLDLAGITFLFAANYHAALRHASAPRREIGVRTFFNILGPLTNPAGASMQLLGVFSDHLVLSVAEVLKRLGSDHAWVVHGRDGLDELTVFDVTHVAELHHGKVRAVLSGEQGAARDIVLLNTAAALMVSGSVPSLEEGVGRAAKAIDSGKAAAKLAELAAFRG